MTNRIVSIKNYRILSKSLRATQCIEQTLINLQDCYPEEIVIVPISSLEIFAHIQRGDSRAYIRERGGKS